MNEESLEKRKKIQGNKITHNTITKHNHNVVICFNLLVSGVQQRNHKLKQVTVIQLMANVMGS